jgi:putative ABC transport system permease protein
MNLRSTLARFRNLFRRNDRDLDAELDAHLDLAINQNLRSGMSPEEARRQAMLQLGGLEQTKERIRDQHILPWLDSLRADAVFGYRQLAKNKITSLAAILSLALAIGSCTAAFRLIDAIFFRPLPVSHPYRLYALTRVGIGPDGKPEDFDGWAYPDFQLMREAAGKNADLIAIAYSGYTDLTYKTDQDMEKAQIQCVAGNMFPVFGLHPALGRLLNESDDVTPGGHPVAVISYDYWLRRFQKDPAVIGKSFRISDKFFQIVGVAPESFVGTEPGDMMDIYLPAMMYPDVLRKDSTWHRTFVSVRPGTAMEPLRAKLDATSRAFEAERAKSFTNLSPPAISNYVNHTLRFESAAAGFSSLQQQGNGRWFGALGVLVLLVLLIACANVANLMVAQAAARAREMALRISIGAGRRHLLQLVLTQSALLALLSSALGGLFAWWAAPCVLSMIYPSEHPFRLFIPIEWRVFAFGFGLTIAVTCLFGLIPAFRASTIDPANTLKGGENVPSRGRVMYALIAAQVAFCCLVLFITGLFVATFQRLSNQPLGFSIDRILTLDTTTQRPANPVVWEQVAEHLRSTPGVDRVSLATRALLDGYANNNSVSVNGGGPSETLGYFLHVSPGWLETMSIRLLDGRDFRPDETSPGAAIVNQTFANIFFHGDNPVGKFFDEVTDDGPRFHYQVVGLVRDTHYRAVREDILPTAYLPFNAVDAATGAPAPQDRATFIVRTTGTIPVALASTLRLEMSKASPDFLVSRIRTQMELVQMQTVRERLFASLGSFFAGVALLLAGVGLYGVLHYSVQQRRREIAIRMAIGAEAANIVRLVTIPLFVTVISGAIAGIMVGLFASRYLNAVFYEVRPTDASMLAIPAIGIIVAACIAAAPATLRALYIDPASTLRAE